MKICLKSADCHVICGRSDSESGAGICVIFFDNFGSIADFHFAGVCAVNKNFVCHNACCIADVIVIDGKGCNAASAADTGFACYDGFSCGNCNVCNGFGAGSCGVIGRDIKNVCL